MATIDEIIRSKWVYPILSAALYVFILFIFRIFYKKILQLLSYKNYCVAAQIGKSLYNPILVALSGVMICSIVGMMSENFGFFFPENILINIITTITSGWLLYNICDSLHDIFLLV